MTETKIPDGFSPHFKKSSFTDPWEPIYSSTLSDRILIGLYLSDAHCNSRGFVHGALIAAIADNAMGLSCGRVIQESGHTAKGLLTISLHTDYTSTAKTGAWLVVDTDYVKCGRSVCFARSLVKADDEVIAIASGTFKVIN